MLKIIILKRDKLGDLLITTPAIQVLRQHFPQAKISLAASTYSSWVVKDAPFIDKIYSYPQYKSLSLKSLYFAVIQAIIFIQIKLEKYDVAIAAGGEYSPHAVKRLRWMGAKRTISYVPHSKPIQGITDPVKEPEKYCREPHEFERIIRLLEPLIGDKKINPTPDVWFSPPQEWLDEARIYLQKNNLNEEQYIVLGLGARRAKKQASKAQVISTVQYAYSKYQLQTIMVWTPGSQNNKNYPGDDELAYEILKDAPEQIIPLRAPLGLTIGLIWLSKKSIFPDSGLMHFAAASPKGVIGLFADTYKSPNPQQWGPLGSKSTYIEADKSISDLSIDFLHKHIDLL